MKVLTAAQMREVDRRTIELGIPGIVLMENAGHRVVEFLEEKFAPLAAQRVVILCGKGNNGGDGFVVARQLHTRLHPRSLHVILCGSCEELRGEAADNYRMLQACGCSVHGSVTPEMRSATIVLDALLGTGLTGAARGPVADFISDINSGFPFAKVVAVDIPSGLASDTGAVTGEVVRADYTVTFTAPKLAQVMQPACDYVGELRVAAIGSPPALYEDDVSIYLALSTPKQFRRLFLPRPSAAHKGDFGHVLVVAGSLGKSGAAAMAGLSALRAGAGLVTVASTLSALTSVSSYCPEVMTEPLAETEAGSISTRALDYDRFASIADRKTVLAIGPGLGNHVETVTFCRKVVSEFSQPMVIDADGLNALPAGFEGRPTMVLTPHPGEMGRLIGLPSRQVLDNRLEIARSYAIQRKVHLVLKGQRTLVASPTGRVWVNPTGAPAMATGGSGDILTGMLAGLIAQFPDEMEAAVLAAVYLHGRAGELGAASLGEQFLIATDLLRFLPDAVRECAGVSDAL